MSIRCIFALLFALVSCSGATVSPHSGGQERGAGLGAGRLRISVSVDWEGAYLDPVGLAELAAFRKALPEVPITHWVCPAYLAKTVPADLAGALAVAVKDRDEVALHLHGWASLARAAGVERKDGPSFFDNDGQLMQFEDGDDGFDLELGAYDSVEFAKILRVSRKLLKSTGVTLVPMFRGGAGIMEKRLFEVLVAEGFVADTSLIQAQFWRVEHEAPPQLGKRVLDVWGPLDDVVDPYWLETSAGKILELPSAPGFGDYASVEDFRSYAAAAARRLAEHPDDDVYIHLGFHQETGGETTEAADYNFRQRVQKAIELIARDYGELIVFERMSDVARRHGARL